MSPAHSGSMFFNYKKTFSIVLLALADPDYKFTFVQVGDFGRTRYGGVYSGSALGRSMEWKTLCVPEDCPLPGSGVHGPMPYILWWEMQNFRSKLYLMRPFPGKIIPRWRRIFNYRLSRARMVVECAFGILASRWRVLYTRMNLKPENADSIYLTHCCMHPPQLPHKSSRKSEMAG